MFPVLFSVGPVTIKTLSVFAILAFFVSSFIFWRKGREEHYEILELFDGFILSSFFGLIAARLAHILLNFNNFGFDIFKWLNLFKNPGSNLIIGVLAAGFYLYRFSIRKKWDSFEVLDFWVTSISLGLSINYIGLFFEGVGYGLPTNLPWGVVFPQLIDPHHPVQMYLAIFYFALYIFLSRVEYSYRTFSWYRYGKKTAQTGFLTSISLILIAFINFFISFFRLAVFKFNTELIFSVILFFTGLLLLYARSGRPLPLPVKRKPKAVRTKLENLSE